MGLKFDDINWLLYLGNGGNITEFLEQHNYAALAFVAFAFLAL
jgi:hypothetical protein